MVTFLVRQRPPFGNNQGEAMRTWIAAQLGINRHTCRLWRNRFIESGPESLWNVAEGRGRKPRRGLAQKIVEATVRTKPTGQTHWSTRTMAARLVRPWRQDP